MFLVAIMEVPQPLEASAQKLATRLGLTLYEARTRLSGEPPRVVSVLADGNEAHLLASGLSRDGFSGVVADGTDIETDDRRAHIQSLAFGAESLEATLRDGSRREVRWADITLLLRGNRTSQQTTTRDETVRSFSAGKALLTGGLMLSSKKTTTTTTTSRQSQAFLYVYDASGEPTLAVYEQRLSYAFLGKQLQPSSLTNFQTVVAEIQKRAPGAKMDTRLSKSPTLGTPPLPPRGVDPNEWKVDIAATLLALYDHQRRAPAADPLPRDFDEPRHRVAVERGDGHGFERRGHARRDVASRRGDRQHAARRRKRHDHSAARAMARRRACGGRRQRRNRRRRIERVFHELHGRSGRLDCTCELRRGAGCAACCLSDEPRRRDRDDGEHRRAPPRRRLCDLGGRHGVNVLAGHRDRCDRPARLRDHRLGVRGDRAFAPDLQRDRGRRRRNRPRAAGPLRQDLEQSGVGGAQLGLHPHARGAELVIGLGLGRLEMRHGTNSFAARTAVGRRLPQLTM